MNAPGAAAQLTVQRDSCACGCGRWWYREVKPGPVRRFSSHPECRARRVQQAAQRRAERAARGEAPEERTKFSQVLDAVIAYLDAETEEDHRRTYLRAYTAARRWAAEFGAVRSSDSVEGGA